MCVCVYISPSPSSELPILSFLCSRSPSSSSPFWSSDSSSPSPQITTNTTCFSSSFSHHRQHDLFSSTPFFPIVIHRSSNDFLTVDVAAAFPPLAALSSGHFRPPEDVCFLLQQPGLFPAALTSRIAVNSLFFGKFQPFRFVCFQSLHFVGFSLGLLVCFSFV